MARQDGFYKVRWKSEEHVMLWTTTNNDNTNSIAGFWTSISNSLNDHDLDVVDERRLTDKEILKVIAL